MKVIVLAHDRDNHTAPIRWALQQAGREVECWPGLASTPERQASISFGEEIRLSLGPVSVNPGDVVWVRRPQAAKHNPNVSPEDKNFAEGEYRWFSLSLLYMLETLPIRVVNPYSSSRFINNKAVQLVLARNCGMKVPYTLMTNSSAAVKDFVHDGHKTICKSFFPHIWTREGSKNLAVTETFEITQAMLPHNDEVLTYAPAIYQEMIVKTFDVRTVLLGNNVYSYALRNPNGSLDWRQDAGQGIVQVEPIETPAAVERGLIEFARQSGIGYGSFDFAIDDQNQWWYLEVNEGGQFLWLDEFYPAAHLQEKFLAFLLLPSGATKAQLEAMQDEFPSWKDYVNAPSSKLYREHVEDGATFVSVEP
jgi:glutathione synthase/RimK-type ligase-like ATP-grasp enzyme